MEFTLGAQTIIWDDIIADPGENYDKVTGAYTAPYDGYYQFTASKRSSEEEAEFFLVIDGASVRVCAKNKGHTSGYSLANCTFMVKLRAGQRVQIGNYGTSLIRNAHPAASYIETFFMGLMLQPL